MRDQMVTERNRKRLARKDQNKGGLEALRAWQRMAMDRERKRALLCADLQELDALSEAEDDEQRKIITRAYEEARRQINAL